MEETSQQTGSRPAPLPHPAPDASGKRGTAASAAAGGDPLRRIRRWLLIPLVTGSGLLMLPMGYLALLGLFLVVPPLVWAAGFMLFVGYCRTLGGATMGVAFWRLSLVFNAVGAVFYSLGLIGGGWHLGDPWWNIALLAGWCALAAGLSIAVERQPGLAVARPADGTAAADIGRAL